jgi:group I intron endonuclease
MMVALPPTASGVYQIRCIPTGKIYVGSAVNLRKRWRTHFNSLRLGSHENSYLQRAWDKYGEENFEVTVLEFVHASDLLCAEQSWINKTKCTERHIGFNICTVADSPLGTKRSPETRRAISNAKAYTWEGFIDPSGDEFTIRHMPDFCAENGLIRRKMYELTDPSSNCKIHRGWTHKNSLHKKHKYRIYEGFIAPDGNPVGPIANLSIFCREHGLDVSCMRGVARGDKVSYKGWMHTNSRPRMREHIKTYSGFIKPNGRPAGSIVNLNAFCREHGLDVGSMQGVASGRVYSHRGWTYDNDRQKLTPPPPPRREKKTYHGFINPEGQRIIINDLQQFCQTLGLNLAHMCDLSSGKRKSHKGWTWKEEEDHDTQTPGS